MTDEAKPEKPAKPWPALYASIWPALVYAGREVGYCMALHGSMARDLDIVAVPWTDDAVSPDELLAAIRERVEWFVPSEVGFQPEHDGPREKPHGRLAWSLHLGCSAYIDLSVLPRKPPSE